MKGDVAALELGKTTALKIGDWVAAGVVVKTGNQSFAKLIFVDKSSMNVGPNSEIKIEKFTNTEEPGVINVVKGIIRSQVTKDHLKRKDKESSKLFITTPNAVMGIRGTEFTVGVSQKEGFAPVTSVVMLEGKVQFSDIQPGKELPHSGAEMDRMLKDHGVPVHGGEASAVNSNQVGHPMVEPFKLSLEQLNKVDKTEVPGMEHKEEKKSDTSAQVDDGHKKGILPKGLDATVVANKPDLKQTASLHHETKVETPAHKSDHALPGSMMDFTTGIVLPPKEGAQYDAVTGTYVSAGDAVAKVNPDGSLAPPAGMEFSPKGTIVVTVEMPDGHADKGKMVQVEFTPPPANQTSKVSMEAVNQVFQQNPQLAQQAAQVGGSLSININQLAPVVAVVTGVTSGPRPASEGSHSAIVAPNAIQQLAAITTPPAVVQSNEVYNPKFIGNGGLTDLVNNSNTYNTHTSGTAAPAEILQQSANNTNVNVHVHVGD